MQDTAKKLETLRQRAEDIFRGQKASSQKDDLPLSVEAMQKTVHELRVHQIELEMQNEELRRAQLELDASRERYFDLYDLAPVAYCTVNEHGLILEANIAAATLLGVARSSLVGQRISRFIVKACQDTYYLYNKRIFTSAEPQAFELQMSKGDDSNFWVNMTTTFAHDSNGAPMQRMVLNDVTDAKIMAAAMQASEARYRAMVEWSPDAIVVHRDGKIIYANPATLKMFGANSTHELVGKALMDRVHPDFQATVMARVKNVTQLKNIVSPMIEEVLLKLDGTPMDVEVQNISTVFDDAPAIQVTMRNITWMAGASSNTADMFCTSTSIGVPSSRSSTSSIMGETIFLSWVTFFTRAITVAWKSGWTRSISALPSTSWDDLAPNILSVAGFA